MKTAPKILAGSLLGLVVFLPVAPAPAATSKEARVTQIIREVNLLPANSDPRAAALNDKVSEETGVRTGGDSRSELTFPDLTITRLGANTIFTFSKSGRTANVDSGSILLRVPKDSGGGSIRSSAVTVAITGTTVIFEKSEEGQIRLIALEGTARVSLNSKPGVSRKVRSGQVLDVPADATELPMPEAIDLDYVMRTHPLIVDFKPLPSEPLIKAVQRAQGPMPPSTRTVGPITGTPPNPTTGNRPPVPPPLPPPPPPSPTVRTRPPAPTPTPTPRDRPPASPTPVAKPTPTATPQTRPTRPPASPTPETKPTPTATPKTRPTRAPVSPTPTASPRPTRSPGKYPKPTPTATPGPILRSVPKPTPNPTPKPLRTPIRVIKKPTPPPGPR